MLCEMDKRTEWHLETPEFVVADTLSGGPFIVSKKHEKEISEERMAVARRTAELVCDFESIEVRMNMCENHWHGHLVNGEVDLSDE
jgi:hypothetical protein